MVGLPGLMDMPCASISMPSKDSRTFTVMSRTPTELPPDIHRVSAAAIPPAAISLRSSKLSRHSPRLTGSAPARLRKAPRV